MRTASGLAALLFGVMAAVQINDPDPYLWTTVYGAAAICSALFVVDALPRWLGAAICGGCGLGLLVLLPRVVGGGIFGPQEMMGLTEATRELGGLTLAAVWTGVLAFRARPDAIEPE